MKIYLNLLSFAFCFTACVAPYKTESQPIAPSAKLMKFNFGTKAKSGYTQVLATSLYTPEKGFGIEAGTNITSHPDFATSDKPFNFQLKLLKEIIM